MTETAEQQEVGVRFPMKRTGCPFDPPPEYERLRADDPVPRATMPDGTKVWLVTRHADVQAAMSDPRLSCDLRSPGFPVPGAGPALPPDVPTPIFRLDPPQHTNYRKLLLPDFTVRQVRALRPRIQRIVDDALDDLLSRDEPADLVDAFALPVPSLVICELLGVPYADHEFFQERTKTALSRLSSPEQLGTALAELRAYLGDLLAARRREPADDLLTKLVRAQAEYDSPEQNVIATAQALITAGHETTANMISLGTVLLLDRPDMLAELRADPSLWPNTVEELLRYLSVADLISARAAKEDVEIGGRTIRAGEGMFLLIGSANRDAEVFPDGDGFDPRRPARGHVAFGYGVHQCLGQNLARAELEIAMETLFRRLPHLRVTEPTAELAYKRDAAIYGLASLPVAWSAP